VLFLTSALTAGGAMLLTIRGLLGPSSGLEGGEENQSAVRILRNILLAGLIAYFAFEFAEFSIALWNPNTHAPAIELILWGPYWWVFWIIHLLVGGLVPLVLLLSRNRNAWILAAVLLAVTFVSTRLNVLVPGQAVGEIRGLQEAFTHDRLTYIYHATAMEYLVGLFLVAVGMAVFFIGQQINRAATARANAA
jgi:molybdopterin-containing oxidoreductase family membrane subunit